MKRYAGGGASSPALREQTPNEIYGGSQEVQALHSL